MPPAHYKGLLYLYPLSALCMTRHDVNDRADTSNAIRMSEVRISEIKPNCFDRDINISNLKSNNKKGTLSCGFRLNIFRVTDIQYWNY